MEILSPDTKSLKEHHAKSQEFISFRHNGIGISLSKGAMTRFVLKPGMRLTFGIEIDRLYFWLTKDQGFLLTAGKHESGIVSSRLLVRHIYGRLPSAKSSGKRYPVRVCNTRINDCATFEILLHEKVK